MIVAASRLQFRTMMTGYTSETQNAADLAIIVPRPSYPITLLCF